MPEMSGEEVNTAVGAGDIDASPTNLRFGERC